MKVQTVLVLITLLNIFVGKVGSLNVVEILKVK